MGKIEILSRTPISGGCDHHSGTVYLRELVILKVTGTKWVIVIGDYESCEHPSKTIWDATFIASSGKSASVDFVNGLNDDWTKYDEEELEVIEKFLKEKGIL